jgi:hypothetical protein
VRDVNAAGSQYVVAVALAAAGALYDRRARWPGVAALVLIAPALWLTGSRTALLGTAAAAVAMLAAANRGRLRVSRGQLAGAAIVLALAAAGSMLLAARASDERGSAGRAMRLRSQFAVTSARMIASAPIYGVGIGRYFERSPEFMPAELRELYGAENAHNYFAQQFAELGVIGGSLFIWLIAAGLIAGWRQLQSAGRDAPLIGLFAGAGGYAVTCITGHPFLVMEVALPFWIGFGVLAGGTETAPAARTGRVAWMVTALLLLVSLGRAAATYAGVSTPPPGRGIDREAEADDGTRFHWLAPHVVTYTSGEAGFLRMMLRAPERPLSRPMVVETAIAGRVIDRRTLPSDRWERIDIPVRESRGTPFSRVDVRVTPPWTDRRTFAQRSGEIEVALTAMAAELRWEEARR